MELNIFMSEVFGTMMLILLGDGVVAGVLLAKTKSNNSGWIVITLAWGLAVFSGVIVAAGVGGALPLGNAHLNPAVTLGLFLNKGIDQGVWEVVPAVIYVAGEFVGAFIGAFLVFLHYYPHWAETEDQGLKLAVFSTGPAIRNVTWNFVSEVIGTFVLMFVIFLIAGANVAGVTVDPTTKEVTSNMVVGSIGSLGALPVALLVVVIGLSLGGTTGYAINPARDLGPRIMHAILPIPGKGGSDWEYSWIPVVGPLVGGIVAAVVYQLVFLNTVVPA
jgi:glycerol uptake facilitator